MNDKPEFLGLCNRVNETPYAPHKGAEEEAVAVMWIAGRQVFADAHALMEKIQHSRLFKKNEDFQTYSNALASLYDATARNEHLGEPISDPGQFKPTKLTRRIVNKLNPAKGKPQPKR